MALLIAAAATVAGLTALLTEAAAGRLLLGGGALALGLIAVSDLVFCPRLTASTTGLTIRTPAVRRQLSWSEIDKVAVDEFTRHGLTARTLEIEAGGQLMVLSRRSLGRDPREVLAELDQLRRS